MGGRSSSPETARWGVSVGEFTGLSTEQTGWMVKHHGTTIPLEGRTLPELTFASTGDMALRRIQARGFALSSTGRHLIRV